MLVHCSVNHAKPQQNTPWDLTASPADHTDYTTCVLLLSGLKLLPYTFVSQVDCCNTHYEYCAPVASDFVAWNIAFFIVVIPLVGTKESIFGCAGNIVFHCIGKCPVYTWVTAISRSDLVLSVISCFRFVPCEFSIGQNRTD